jgi:hypothetical protein
MTANRAADTARCETDETSVRAREGFVLIKYQRKSSRRTAFSCEAVERRRNLNALIAVATS